MFLSTNIKFLRNRKKKNQEDTAIDLEMTRVKYNSYENGYRNNLPAEDLIRVSEYFGFSIDVLLKRDLTKLKEFQLLELSKGSDTYAKGNKIRVLTTTVDKKNRENIEYVPIKVKAGYLTGCQDPDFIASLPKVVLPFVDDKGKTMRFFDCSGDSMLPLDTNCQVLGEFIQDWSAIKDGTKCIVISHTKGYAIKEVYNQIKSKKTLRLHSTNSEYKDYELNINDINEIWEFKGFFSKKFPDQTIDDNDKKNLSEGVQKLLKTINKLNPMNTQHLFDSICKGAGFISSICTILIFFILINYKKRLEDFRILVEPYAHKADSFAYKYRWYFNFMTSSLGLIGFTCFAILAVFAYLSGKNEIGIIILVSFGLLIRWMYERMKIEERHFM